MRLKDKVCIITGAGMGIGKAAALMFAREGAKVVVADVLVKEGQETIDAVRAKRGEAAFIQTDVSKAAEVQRMVKFAVETYGKLDVLYNNASIGMPMEDGMITELEEGVWDKTIDINLKSIYLCCKYAVPELIKAGGGSIINVGSVTALVGFEFPAYSASKGGIVALTRVIAREYGNKNIRCNVICPGRTETRQLAATRAAAAARPLQFPGQDTLLRRAAKPEEIASLVLFLASDESSFMTGAVLPIDGGWTAV